MPRAIWGSELLLVPIKVETAKLSTVSLRGSRELPTETATLLSSKLFKEAFRERCCLYSG